MSSSERGASTSPASPCIKICSLDPTGRICVGCKRTLDEIAAWKSMSDQRRRELIDELATRPHPDPA